MYVPYILYRNKDGYAIETKLMCDLNTPPPLGNPIKTHYFDKVDFYNVSGLHMGEHNYIAQNAQFIKISAEDAYQKLIENLQQKYTLVANSNNKNISYEEESGSILGQMRSYFFNNNIQIPEPDASVSFDSEKYKKNHNEFYLYSSLRFINHFSTPDIMTLRKMQKALNTLLLNENTISVSDLSSIHCYTYESLKQDMLFIDEVKAIHDMDSIGSYYNRGTKHSTKFRR